MFPKWESTSEKDTYFDSSLTDDDLMKASLDQSPTQMFQLFSGLH